MSEFRLNPEIMVEMAVLCSSSGAVMSEATQLTNSILSHDDWFCKEKVKIDERINALKSNAIALQEAFEDYSSAIQELSNQVLEFVRAEETEYSDIEAELGQLLTLLSGGAEPTVDAGNNVSFVCTEIASGSSNMDVMNVVANWDKPIPIVSFADVMEV